MSQKLTPGTKVKFVVPRTSQSYAKMNHMATVHEKGPPSGAADLLICFDDGQLMQVMRWQIQTTDAVEGPSCRTST